MNYNNTALTLTNQGTPDPFVINANGKFYMVRPSIGIAKSSW